MNDIFATSSYDFDLPERLIAQYPTEERGASRLLVLDRQDGSLVDSMVSRLLEHLDPGTLMVFNNSRVRKARLHTQSATGGRVEVLLLKPLADSGGELSGRRWLAMVSKSRRQSIGKVLSFPGGREGRILSLEEDGLRAIEFSLPMDDSYLEEWGHIPLPPYITRQDSEFDETRYQTVYAQTPGSAAAPTAGLHFTEDLFSQLQEAGIQRAELTLHVGIATFLPVRTQSILDHRMHEEDFEIGEECARLVTRAKEEGRPVLAVGSTSVRCLESSWDAQGRRLKSGYGSTKLFLYPGKEFRVVDQMFTNFHTPRSSLLMMVSAFAGKDRLLAAYREAVRQEYRFFSYGDAMLIR